MRRPTRYAGRGDTELVVVLDCADLHGAGAALLRDLYGGRRSRAGSGTQP